MKLRYCGQPGSAEVAFEGAGSRDGGDRARVEWLPAVRARGHGGDDVPAGGMPDLQGRSAGGGPPVAPLAHGRYHVPQVAALIGEPVLRARRMVLVGDALEDPAAHQVVQSPGKDVAGDAQACLELIEAGHAEESVPDDEQAPPFAYHVEALGN